MTTTEKTGFYGFEWGTYYCTNGRTWLVQSDDHDRLPVEVDHLPEGGEWLPRAVCHDLDLTGVASSNQ